MSDQLPILKTYPTVAAVAAQAARFLAQLCQQQLQTQARVSVALSGGRTPWAMLDELAGLPLEWQRMDVFQVDERIVGSDDLRLNATKIQQHWISKTPATTFYPMPVTKPTDDAIGEYARLLEQVCPRGLDVVCLGLGADGHTASLIPGDPLCLNSTAVIGQSIIYQETTRLTLLRKPLNQAKHKLWLVTGSDKRHALTQLLQQDTSVPAGLITGPATVFADNAAAGI